MVEFGNSWTIDVGETNGKIVDGNNWVVETMEGPNLSAIPHSLPSAIPYTEPVTAPPKNPPTNEGT